MQRATAELKAKFECYERLIPEKDRLNRKLDYDGDCDLHLHEIARVLKNWELVAPWLKLTQTDIDDIKDACVLKPELQRVKCLQKWKLKLGFEATYGLLLDVFLRTENDKCADKIVELLRGDPAKRPTDGILDTAQSQPGDQYPLPVEAVPGKIAKSVDRAIRGRWRLLSILRDQHRRFNDASSEYTYMEQLWKSLCMKLMVPPSPYPLNQDENRTSVTIDWLISTSHAWKVLERIQDVVKFFEIETISTVRLENVSIYCNSSIAHQEIKYVKLLLTIQDAENLQDRVCHFFQENFPDINAPVIEEEGKTALILAAEHGHECVVYSLLELQPQIDVNYQTQSEQWSALFFAYKKEHVGVVKLLLEYAADSTLRDKNRRIASDLDPTKRGLKYYLKKGKEYAKKKLHTSKWDHRLLILSAKGDYEGVKSFLQESQCSVDVDEDGWTALSIACSNNFVRIASLLLEKRADPNSVIGMDSSNFTPLMYISDMDHVEPLATVLLQNGANLEIESKPNGWTPLMLACHCGNKDLVQLYLDYSAEVDKCAEKGWTALMSAARSDKADIIRLLIAKGASMEEKMKDSDSKVEGESALHIASYTGSASAVKVLVELGADPNSLNEAGLSALMIATQRNQLEVVETLCNSETIDINLHQERFLPALLIAAKNGHDKILTKLLKCGAYVPEGILMLDDRDIGRLYNKKIIKELDKYKQQQQQQRKQEKDKHQSTKHPRSIPAGPVHETSHMATCGVAISALEKTGRPENKEADSVYSEKLKEMSDKHDRNWNRYVKTKGPHFESDIYEDTEKGVGTDQHIQHSMATDGDGSSIHNLQLLETHPLPEMSDFQLVTNNRGEKYALINNISGRWRKIGTHLRLTQNQLDGIGKNKYDEEERFRAVMDHWISNAAGLPNASKYPYSWVGLHTLLVNSELSTYADEFIDFIVLAS